MTNTEGRELLVNLEVQELVSREVALLDSRRFEEWLDLFDERVRYWMPVLVTTDSVETALAGPDGLAWFDEDHASLGLRVQRLASPKAHAEHPPPRTRRFVFVTSTVPHGDDEVEVSANFAIYRSRRERDIDLFVGARTDRLVRRNGSFKILERRLQLDQDIVENRDLSVLF